jgi:arylsulfatase A-like enzyme
MLTRRDFINRVITGASAYFVTDCLGVAGLPKIQYTAEKRHPNIILIVADDLGYAELGCQGCKDIPTPYIDSIAAGGVRFTQGYVSCPVCAPTRAGLLTGRYQQRFGFETNPGPQQYADDKFGLPIDQLTLAERLKKLGYTTGMFGKWHLGYKPELTPPKRGFDEFYGFLSGAHNYLPGGRRSELRRGMEAVKDEKEYLTDAFGREAAAFIEKNKERPFFLYLPFNAVHGPLEASDKYLKRVANIKETNRRTYAAVTLAMDDAVGRVLETLKKTKLEENTLIIFISDNGGPTPQTTSSNAPLRGYKGQVWEGGIRVPFIVQWTGQLPAGKSYNKPVISLDIVPTVLAAIGKLTSADDKLDGVNLLPYLNGKENGEPHDVLYWRFHNKQAIRAGDWKLVREQRQGRWELYNLADDIGESRDLADKMPEKVKELDKKWQQWNAQLQSPKWIRQDSRTEKHKSSTDASPRRQSGTLKERFESMDKNDDGKLDRGEIPAALSERLDADKDGFVTDNELKALWKDKEGN